MKRSIAVMIAAFGLVAASRAYAQESTPGPGTVVVTVIPGGVTFFTQGKNTNEPSFGNYGVGAGVEAHFNRYVSVEGEATEAVGVTQDVQFVSATSHVKTPNLLSYNGNLVIAAANRSSVVPYVTGGVGGLTLLDTSTLGISDTKTFLTGNVGAGVKWYSAKGRWGLRGDYRFIAVRSDETAPSFFGQETRYGHRIYGAVLVGVAR